MRSAGRVGETGWSARHARHLLHHQVGLQGAGRLDALQDGDDAVGLDAEPVEAANQRFQVGAVEDGDARVRLRRVDRRVRARPPSRPCENGSGWTTLGISVMRTVSVPWLIATFEMRTSWPMTIVPVRSSMTTRAGVSDWTSRFSSSAMKRAGEMFAGLCSMTVRESCSLATALAEAVPRIFVDHVGDHDGGREIGVAQLQRQRAEIGELGRRPGVRPCAPFGTRPAVGTPCVSCSASPFAEKPETETGPCATA